MGEKLTIELAELTAAARKRIPKGSFAIPEKRAYPIHDRSHAANALARAKGKPEWGRVKKAVCSRYPDMPACQTKMAEIELADVYVGSYTRKGKRVRSYRRSLGRFLKRAAHALNITAPPKKEREPSYPAHPKPPVADVAKEPNWGKKLSADSLKKGQHVGIWGRPSKTGKANDRSVFEPRKIKKAKVVKVTKDRVFVAHGAFEGETWFWKDASHFFEIAEEGKGIKLAEVKVGSYLRKGRRVSAYTRTVKGTPGEKVLVPGGHRAEIVRKIGEDRAEVKIEGEKANTTFALSTLKPDTSEEAAAPQNPAERAQMDAQAQKDEDTAAALDGADIGQRYEVLAEKSGLDNPTSFTGKLVKKTDRLGVFETDEGKRIMVPKRALKKFKPSATPIKKAKKRHVLFADTEFAADSLMKATIHEPVGKPGGPGLWHKKGWQLPAYIQHIANELKKKGMSESRAIATAIAAVKRWAAGGGNVDANTRAAAQKALAEWEALKAKAKVD